MGLFSSVIHVRDANAEIVCKALAEAVPSWKFKLTEQRVIPNGHQYAPSGSLQYLVSPLYGSWSTIIESHSFVEGAPWLSELARSLSAALGNYTLSLMVHDDDVLFYNLCKDGLDLDGYNSNPQYFETARLSADSIGEQRHDPRPFAPLLPEGVNISELQTILDRGWWSACNAGRLDNDGVQPEDEPSFVFEGERMIAIGNLLQLHGRNDGYPFAGWADAPRLEWNKFHDLRFERA